MENLATSLEAWYFRHNPEYSEFGWELFSSGGNTLYEYERFLTKNHNVSKKQFILILKDEPRPSKILEYEIGDVIYNELTSQSSIILSKNNERGEYEVQNIPFCINTYSLDGNSNDVETEIFYNVVLLQDWIDEQINELELRREKMLKFSEFASQYKMKKKT